MDKQQPAQRIRPLDFMPLIMILVAVVLHDLLVHIALMSHAPSAQIYDLLDLLLAITFVLAYLYRNERPLPQAASEAEGARGDRLRMMTTLLNTRVEEHRRELAASQAALARENEERTFAEEKLHRVNTLDPLTGLLKRSAFIAALEQRRSQRQGLIAVFFIDIDHFKMINDGLGDEFADRVLIVIADRLAYLAPHETIVGRVGGDEYALSCAVDDQSVALTVGEQIRAALVSPIGIDLQRIHTTASIGLRLSSERSDHAAALLRDAHTAMHRAKFAGRARLMNFNPTMRDEIESRYALTSDLHQAILDCQIFVEYQAIHDLLSGKTIAYEALARWEHPDRGRVEPGVFIPAAEDNGLVAAIGEQVLEDACKQILEYHITPSTPIGINLSARQLAETDVCEMIARIIAHYEINPLCLLFEITESTIVESLNLARGVLLRLKDLGLRIAIDDFGTGYSSLSYLRSLPFDVLKIDRSFIRHIATEEHSRDIVRMIVTLAESLDMSVVAEGIETEEQLNTLRDLGCYRGQGYLFSRPLPAEQAFSNMVQSTSAVRL